MAVLPSPDSETEIPCWAATAPIVPVPTSLLPCWVQATLLRTKTHVDPMPLRPTLGVTGGEAGVPPEALEEDIERLEPLTGVKAFPVRVKCATLPWHAFEAALKSGFGGETVKTE